MMINNNPCLCSPVQKWATQWPLAGRPRSQCHLIYYPAWALSAHKQSHYVRQIIATLLRQNPRATPLGANSRASESKASSSLECSAERSRESTKLTFCCVSNSRATPCGRKLVCSYRPSRPGFKSFSRPEAFNL